MPTRHRSVRLESIPARTIVASCNSPCLFRFVSRFAAAGVASPKIARRPIDHDLFESRMRPSSNLWIHLGRAIRTVESEGTRCARRRTASSFGIAFESNRRQVNLNQYTENSGISDLFGKFNGHELAHFSQLVDIARFGNYPWSGLCSPAVYSTWVECVAIPVRI
jgi:hypothetical protein